MRRKRNSSILPLCVACLYGIGWGIKRVCRHTGFSQTTVHRFVKFNGLSDPFRAEAKRVAVNAAKTKRADKAEAERKAQAALDRMAKPAKPKRTEQEKRANALAYYYANYEANKARLRAAQFARYHSTLKHSPEFKAKTTARNKTKWAEKKARLGIKKREPVTPLSAWRRGKLVRFYRSKAAAYIGANGSTILRLVGCTSAHLTQHIEAQFLPGMTWGNRRAWHVDHIKPCARFNLLDPHDVSVCFHWTNLQPLWALDNLKKGDKAA